MSESYTNVYWMMEQGSEALQGGQAYWYFIVTFCNIHSGYIGLIQVGPMAMARTGLLFL